jgi:myo-inositol 2-dehydrogenase/D-chiro-inositol 1-dehydrogenase
MTTLKIGIAGLGRLGFIHASHIASKISDAELTAVCDIHEDRLAKAKQHFDPEYTYTSFPRLLENKELDAVALVTPSALHCGQIEQSLEAGFHVFCEKPLGVNLEECMMAKKAVDDHPDLIFMLGFMRRYDESYRYVKRKIDDGEIGKPVLFRGYTVDPVSAIDSVLSYIPQSAGQFMDMAVHDIDLARWYLKSEPATIYAIGGCYAYPQFKEYDDGDNVSALMQFENESMAFILAGRTAPHGYQVETEIIGTRSMLRIASVPQKNLVEILDESGVRKECSNSFEERFDGAFIHEMQEFVDCILENRKPEVRVDDGVESTRIAELATKCFKSNELIKIKR